MKNIIKNNLFSKKNVLVVWTVLLALAANAQVGILTQTPRPNAVLHIESSDTVYQGLILPKANESNIILQDVITVRPDELIPVNNDGLMFFEATSQCFRYYNLQKAQWWNMCGTPPPADVELGNCYQAAAMGTYLIHTPLDINNYLQLPIKVNKAGTYSITTVVYDAANNIETYYFTTNGAFPLAGEFTVNVPGVGETATAGNHTVKVTINETLQNCDIPITVQPRDPDYAILSVEQLNPQWNIMTNLADGTYKVSVKLLVYNPGTWGLTSSEVNGYTFGATGEISQSQGYNPDGGFPQTVTVLVPVAAGMAINYGTGIDKFTMSTTTSRNASNCDFVIELSKGGYKLNRVLCDDVVLHISSAAANGKTDTLTNGHYFVSDAYISVPIEVTAPGEYVCYAEFAGVQFATCTDNGTAWVISPVALSAPQMTLTMHPVGPKANTNPNRMPHTNTFNTPILLRFSAGDREGPDGILGNADDWMPEYSYFQADQFCRPQIVVKSSVARFSNLVLATQAPTSGSSAYANGMRYSYDSRIASSNNNYKTQAQHAATQGVYTIDNAGNTPITVINLTATYTIPGSYRYHLQLGVGGDSVIYSAWGELPPIPAGQTQGTATIPLTIFRKNADGQFLDINGNLCSQSGLVPAPDIWENGVQINTLPQSMPKGRISNTIPYYTSADNPLSDPPSGRLEIPLTFGYRTMKVVSWGENTDYTMNGSSSRGHDILNSDNNFGYNGVTPVGDINVVSLTHGPSISDATFLDNIRNADVLLVQYPYTLNTERTKYVKSFINRGGAVMLNSENIENLRSVLSSIYSSTFTAGSYGLLSGGHIFGVNDDPDSPLLHGPFNQFLPGGQSISALGEDNTGISLTRASVVNNIPGVKILSYRNSSQDVFVFFDESKCLLVTGDGGFLSSRSGLNNHGPVYSTSANRPAVRTGYSTTSGYPSSVAALGRVYNAFLFCNYLDFAVKYAAAHRDHSNDNNNSSWQ